MAGGRTRGVRGGGQSGRAPNAADRQQEIQFLARQGIEGTAQPTARPSAAGRLSRANGAGSPKNATGDSIIILSIPLVVVVHY